MLPTLDNQVHGKNILLVQPFFLSLHIGMPFGTICWSWLLLVIRWAIMPFVCPIGKEALDPGLLALGALLELWESGLLHPQPALAPWGAAVDTPPKWITWNEMAKVNYGGGALVAMVHWQSTFQWLDPHCLLSPWQLQQRLVVQTNLGPWLGSKEVLSSVAMTLWKHSCKFYRSAPPWHGGGMLKSFTW